MNKRHLKIIIPAVALLLICSICATVYALMIDKTPTVENNFTPAFVACEVYKGDIYTYPDGAPSYISQHNNIRVKNTGNIDEYLRVRFVSYWVKYNSETSSWEVTSKPSEMPTFAVESGWIAGSNDTYYYKSPVAPGDLPTVVTGSIVLEKNGEYVQVLEVFAEAVQSLPTTAVTSAWHVTLDGNGNIVSAP